MKISFCIPTYNHGAFLGFALDSILGQAPSNFEIVVVDGASRDNTPDVVARYQRVTDKIVYKRIQSNRGVDPDIAESVALATGDYCWLMSSDDVIPPGAIASVMSELESGDSVYIGDRLDCTKDLKVFGRTQLFDTSTGQTWDMSRKSDLLSYAEHASSLMALFSYISVLIFQRSFWNASPSSESFFGSCYAHAHRLWGGLKRGGSLRYIAKPIVMCRMDNDSFSAMGFYRRSMLDLDGYAEIAGSIFNDDPGVRAAFHSVLRTERNVLRLGKLYAACTDASQRRRVDERIATVGYSTNVVAMAKAVGAIGPLLGPLIHARRWFYRSIGAWLNMRHEPPSQ